MESSANETCYRVAEKGENVVKKEKPTLKKNCLESKKVIFKYMDIFSDLAFRVLLIDDKIGPNDGKKDGKNNQGLACAKKEFEDIKDGYTIEVKECEACLQNTECKLNTIKQLMNYRLDNQNKDIFHYWKQNDIKTYYYPTVIKDFITAPTIDKEINIYPDKPQSNNPKDEEQNERDVAWEQYKKDHSKVLNIRCHFAPQMDDRNNLHVQIIGVRDVRTALLLMSKFKFDMIFCDYLLDYKDYKSNSERDYATQLLAFLSHDNKDEVKTLENKIKELTVQGKNTDDEKKKLKRLEVLNQFRHDVLDNRGPLDKLWIMPITGFNQTFIQDLYRNRIDLIGHKWNISNGADPITTPWQFLYHLNKFIELQLKHCVYRMNHLLRFLLYTWEDLDAKLKWNNGRGRFYAFQAFMGAEYANFMRRYGNRHIIQRDAIVNKDNPVDKSVFATYIWKNFYWNPEYRDVIELNRLIQMFLHQAATLHNDRTGQQRLEETFGQLCFFIDTNQKVRDAIEDEEDLKGGKLGNALMGLRATMDELMSNKHDDFCNIKNKK